MTQIDMHDAKSQLSRLVERAAEGEDIVIHDDFDGPLPEELVAPLRGDGPT